jgi:hypothetical protein
VYFLTEAFSFLRKNELMQICIYIFFLFAKSKYCSLLVQKEKKKKKQKKKKLKKKQKRKKKQILHNQCFFDFQKQAVKALRL